MIKKFIIYRSWQASTRSLLIVEASNFARFVETPEDTSWQGYFEIDANLDDYLSGFARGVTLANGEKIITKQVIQ